MADYGQPVAATRRVRFFDGQFLVEQDFVDEQKYHIDRERRLGRVLRVTGVVDGLLVSSPEANKVLVRAGTAIDRDGRQLVLADDRTVDLPPASFNDQQGVRLVVVYRETAVDMATEGGTSQRRWLEDPLVVAVDAKGATSSTETWDTELPTVLLALLRLDNQGRVTVDATAAELAGMVVPGVVGIGSPGPAGFKLGVNGRTRLGAANYGADPVLSVAPGTVNFDAPNVVGGRLTIDGNTGNVGIGTNALPDYKLTVNGRTRLGGSADHQANAVLSVAPGTVNFDAPNVVGGRLVIDGTTGNVGVGGAAEAAGGYKLSVNGRVRLGGVGDHKANVVLSVAPGAIQFDAPNVFGGRLAIDGTTGNVGIGVPAPTAKVDVAGAGDKASNVSLLLRGGNSANNFSGTVLGVGYNDTNLYRHAIRTRHNGGAREGNAFDFFVWKSTDKPETPAGVHNLTLDGGYVGIGTTAPRTALDLVGGVMSGAANDYVKAQFTLSGGGTVTWAGPDDRLKWTERFLAISMERGRTFSDGHVSIKPPDKDIPADNVHDGLARSATRNDGVLLKDWEALYAVHKVGGNSTDVEGFQIRHWQKPFHAPSNWILVAVVNSDDDSLKLGTGTTLAKRSSHTNGNHLPVGMIMMWSGPVASIPYGWALCDGANGLPDLSGRFVVGVDQKNATKYNPKDAGEADTHAHTTTINANTISTASVPDHNHRFPDAWRKEDLYSQTVVGARGAIDPYGAPPQNNTTKNSGSHAHSLPAVNMSFGTSSSTDLGRPRWYALCFIIKL